MPTTVDGQQLEDFLATINRFREEGNDAVGKVNQGIDDYRLRQRR